GRARVRDGRGPRRARPRLPCSRPARAEDPPPALLRRTDPVADRSPGRHLPDARVAPDHALAREAPRRARRRRARARARAATLASQTAAVPCPGVDAGRIARGVPGFLRGARAPACALALARTARGRPLAAVRRRRDAAVQAVLPRHEGAARQAGRE